MQKASFDLNHVQIHPDGKSNGVQNSRRDSIVDGRGRTSTSGYVFDC